MSALTVAGVSGVFASLASVFSKLTFSSTLDNPLESLILGTACGDEWDNSCWAVFGVLRCVSLGGMLACNALMLVLFTKAMQQCRSTSEAVVTNNATNLVLTAIIGTLLFGEVLGLLWWCGAGLVVTGLAVMRGQRQEEVGEAGTSEAERENDGIVDSVSQQGTAGGAGTKLKRN